MVINHLNYFFLDTKLAMCLHLRHSLFVLGLFFLPRVFWCLCSGICFIFLWGRWSQLHSIYPVRSFVLADLTLVTGAHGWRLCWNHRGSWALENKCEICLVLPTTLNGTQKTHKSHNSNVKCWNNLSCLDQYTAPNSKYTGCGCLPQTQMEVSAPIP